MLNAPTGFTIAMQDTAKPENSILLPIRLSLEGDRLLRTSTKAYEIGNLTQRVLAAIEGVDLATVKVEERPKRPGKQKNPTTKQDYQITTVRLPAEVREHLRATAESREVSMSALVDGAIRKFYKDKKPKSK
jgi:Ribbon-helix-helix protein, copG family.